MAPPLQTAAAVGRLAIKAWCAFAPSRPVRRRRRRACARAWHSSPINGERVASVAQAIERLNLLRQSTPGDAPPSAAAAAASDASGADRDSRFLEMRVERRPRGEEAGAAPGAAAAAPDDDAPFARRALRQWSQAAWRLGALLFDPWLGRRPGDNRASGTRARGHPRDRQNRLLVRLVVLVLVIVLVVMVVEVVESLRGFHM